MRFHSEIWKSNLLQSILTLAAAVAVMLFMCGAIKAVISFYMATALFIVKNPDLVEEILIRIYQ